MGPPKQPESVIASKRKQLESHNPSPTPKKPRLDISLNLSASQDDSRILESLDSKFDVKLHSIISSSKIQAKVTSVLRHLTPTAEDATVPQKPRVSVLRAKAHDASKLISVAEISKREISQGKEDEGEGHWYQYIALGEQLRESPRVKNGDRVVVEETRLDDANEDEANDDAEFETMKTPFERALEGRPIVRSIPVMSLFLARVPLDSLKGRYGEQSNYKAKDDDT